MTEEALAPECAQSTASEPSTGGWAQSFATGCAGKGCFHCNRLHDKANLIFQ